MSRYDFRAPRVYLQAAFGPDAIVPLERPQGNYLINVMRLRMGDGVLAFNGRDGEWRTELSGTAKRPELRAIEQARAQTAATDLHYLFAPLKHARLDYMTQKAVEMGASRLQPVLTRHTQVARLNLDRMRANAIEAAEQCGILNIPDIREPIPLAQAIDAFPPERVLIFCDEDADSTDPVAALAQAQTRAGGSPPLAVLVGPEGGFTQEERQKIVTVPRSVRLSLGPRILRADTAAVAALALANAVLGDWR